MSETSKDTPPTLLERMGGVAGLVYASVPTFAYVVVSAIAGLDAAVVVAVGASAGLVLLRVVRREPIQPAVSGLLGVVVAALIAFYSGSAQGFFLPGIWMSLLMAVAFTVSLVVRRPLVGVLWNLLTSAETTRPWRSDASVLHGFDVATLVFAAVFASRYAVQQWLYDAGATGWLAVARIAMGYPLLAVALLVTYWAARRAKRRFAAVADEQRERLLGHGPVDGVDDQVVDVTDVALAADPGALRRSSPDPCVVERP